MTAQEAMQAIKARIQGEFDNEFLQRIGDLDPNPLWDIEIIIEIWEEYERLKLQNEQEHMKRMKEMCGVDMGIK